jgi:hypothetical protein
MPCPPEMACQAICRSGKRCSRFGNHETKLCGLHTIVEKTCQGICLNGKRCLLRSLDGIELCRKHVMMSDVKTISATQEVITRTSCVECDEECPVCYCSPTDVIICPNGHKICGEHYLSDIASLSATRVDNHIKCFVCRVWIDSKQFDLEFIKKLPVAYAKAIFPSRTAINTLLQSFTIDIMKMLNHIE